MGETQKENIMRSNFNKRKFMESMKRYGKILTEGEAMYDDYDMGYEQKARMNRGIPERMPEDDEAYDSPNNSYAPGEGEMCAEEEDMDLSKQDEKISQIREIALQGLQEYAENVDSPVYEFYKKVWLMCDKAVSEKKENEAEQRNK